MNRKTLILDRSSPITPNAIDLKFVTRDYVVGAAQHAETQNNRLGSDFLRSSGEHAFGSIATVFEPYDAFRWRLIS